RSEQTGLREPRPSRSRAAQRRDADRTADEDRGRIRRPAARDRTAAVTSRHARVAVPGRCGLALLSALLLGGCEAEREAPVAAPKLAFAHVAYDFGRVAQGTPVEHRFPFVNE